jgi:hypothetical protein
VAVDKAQFDRFRTLYARNFEKPRKVFEEFLPILGSSALLDYLEQRFPQCHGEAHDLGRAMYASRKDLAGALTDCGHRCSAGCMHGAVEEAFGSEDLTSLVSKMNEFCGSSAMSAYQPGNCAHALGHAFMLVSKEDVATSLNACLYFNLEAMRSYCSGGVFMQLFMAPTAPKGPAASAVCDQFSQFPASCYRFSLPQIYPLNVDGAFAECQGKTGAQRRGCYHGLGTVLSPLLHKDPTRLAAVCGSAGPEELAMCVDGAVDKLSQIRPDWAQAICDGNSGEVARLCKQAVADGLYKLDKATVNLYYEAQVVGERKPLTAAPEHDHIHHH